jgi:hypothetical protein
MAKTFLYAYVALPGISVEVLEPVDLW